VLGVLQLPTFGGRVTGARLARVRANPLYRDGKFVNVLPQSGYSFADIKLIVTEQFKIGAYGSAGVARHPHDRRGCRPRRP